MQVNAYSVFAAFTKLCTKGLAVNCSWRPPIFFCMFLVVVKIIVAVYRVEITQRQPLIVHNSTVNYVLGNMSILLP